MATRARAIQYCRLRVLERKSATVAYAKARDSGVLSSAVRVRERKSVRVISVVACVNCS